MKKILYKKIVSIGTALLFLLAGVANFVAPVATTYAAAIPTILSYQGRLSNSSSDLLGGSGTTYYFKFSIWDNATVGSGNRVWPASAPALTSATVRQGVFNVNIGDTTAGYPDTLNYDFSQNTNVYLQVEVSSDGSSFQTLSPRQRIASNAFAQTAGSVSGTNSSFFGATSSFGPSVVSILASSTSAIPLSIRAATGQTANLVQIQDSLGGNLFFVNAGGAVFASSTLLVDGAVVFGSTLNAGTTTVTNLAVSNTSTSTFAGGLSALALNITGVSTSTFANGIQLATGCFRDPSGSCISGGGAISSVSNSDSTLTISPTTGAVVASLNLSNPNSWTGKQTFNQASSTLFSVNSNLYIGGSATTTILGDSATSSFSGGLTLSSGNVNLPSSGVYLINNQAALTASALGSSILASSLTSVGALDSGSITSGFGSINTGADNITTTGLASFGTLSLTGSTTLQNFTATNATTTNATSTSFQTATLGVGNQYFTNLLGTGLQNTSGALTLNATGDWTGTFDGQQGSYYLDANNLTNFGTPFYSFFSATNTDALAEGSTNKYWSNTLFDNRLSASTSIAGITTLANLSLPFSQTTGTVGVTRGGTGQTSFGQGWLHSDGSAMTASTSPTVAYITATSTSATSTFSTGGLAIGGSQFVVQQNSGRVGIGTTAPTAKLEINNTDFSYSNLLKIGGRTGVDESYGLLVSPNIQIATAAVTNIGGMKVLPTIADNIAGIEATNYRGIYVPVPSSNGTVTNAYGLYVDAPTQGTTVNAAAIFNGSVGIGTTTPYAKFSVSGKGVFEDNVYSSYFTATSTTATSTLPNLSATNFLLGTDYITDLTGTGLQNTSGALTLNATGDWTGTFDGQQGSYYLDANNLTNFGTPFYSFFSATNTDALAEGSTNKYWSNTLFDNRLSASTSIAGITTLGNLSLPLSQTTGTLALNQGGTGQTSFGQGWLHSDGSTMTASTSPTVAYITATSTTATSSFAGGISSSALKVTGNNTPLIVEAGGAKYSFSDDAGGMSHLLMNASSEDSLSLFNSTVTGAIVFNTGKAFTIADMPNGDIIDKSYDGSPTTYYFLAQNGNLTLGSGFIINASSTDPNYGLNTFITQTQFNQASSTLFSVLNNLYIGNADLTTIVGDSATSSFSGGLTLASGNVNLATNGVYLINNAMILSASALGSSVLSSSLTSVGALTSGSIASGFGSINNGANSITTTGAGNFGTLNTTGLATFSGNVGIGTTTPNWPLQVAGTRPSFALSDTSAGANLKHWLFSSMGGNLYVGTTTDAYATSTPSALSILNNGTFQVGTSSLISSGVSGYVGLGTTTPSARLHVSGTSASDVIRTDMGLDINPVVYPSSAPTLALVASPGNVDAGTHYYYVSYVTKSGDTNLKRQSTPVVTDASNGQVTVTIPTSSDYRVTGRKIYRTPAASGSSFWVNVRLVATVADNTTTTYLDNVTDASLGSGLTNYYNENLTSKQIQVNGVTSVIISTLNTVMGYGAGATLLTGTQSSENTLIGVGAGDVITSGVKLVALGNDALGSVTSGSDNIGLGHSAGSSITTGSGNVSIGRNSGLYNQTGSSNVYIGGSAGAGASSQSHSYNTGVGGSALTAVTTGGYNSTLGYYSGVAITSGARNIILGYKAGENLVSGSNNIIIGYDIDATSTTAYGSLNIGNIIFGTGLDGTGTTLSTGNIGVGTTTPWRDFAVTGTVGFDGLTTNTGAAAASLCLSSTNEVTKNTDNETCLTSSLRFKENVNSLSVEKSLATLSALRSVSFEYIGTPGIRYGLIAEEVDAIDKTLVGYDAEGRPNSVRYISLVPLLVQGFQDLSRKINEMPSAGLVALSSLAEKITSKLAIFENLFTSTITIVPNGQITVPAGENQMAGEGVLPAGEASIFVVNTKVASTSQIIVTPAAILNAPLAVTEKREGEGFTLSIKTAEPEDVPFDYLIIQTYGRAGRTPIILPTTPTTQNNSQTNEPVPPIVPDTTPAPAPEVPITPEPAMPTATTTPALETPPPPEPAPITPTEPPVAITPIVELESEPVVVPETVSAPELPAPVEIP